LIKILAFPFSLHMLVNNYKKGRFLFMKVKTMLLTSFAGMAVITFAVGFIAFIISGETLDKNNQVNHLSEVRVELTAALAAHNEWKSSLEEAFVKNSDSIDIQFDGHECSFGNWYYEGGLDELARLSPEAAENLYKIEENHLNLHASAQEINDIWEPVHTGLSEELYHRLNDHNVWALNLVEDIMANRKSDVQTDPTKCGFGLFLDGDMNREMMKSWPEYKAIMDPIIVRHNELHRTVLEINQSNNAERRYAIFNEKIKSELSFIEENFNKIIALEAQSQEHQKVALSIFEEKTVPNLIAVKAGIDSSLAVIQDLQIKLNQEASEIVALQNVVIWAGIIIGVILGIIIALFITRSLTSKLGGEPAEIANIAEQISEGNLTLEFDNRKEMGIFKSMKEMTYNLSSILTDINSASNQVGSGSTQISSSSQQISSGASEQASSTEEISSSMEELSANIQQNTENAQKADKIARNVTEEAAVGGESVNDTVLAMRSISEKIAIIEDIARNTNMLALNAAIEAARAGEAGKGFAVVASEVRKLAENSGKAASEITEISKSSVEAAENAGTIINELVPKIQETADLVQEITVASEEQSRGAEQINSALQQLDTVIQQNASSSEELASMSEELNSQAEMMVQSITYFKLKKDTGKAANRTSPAPQTKKEPVSNRTEVKALPESTKNEDDFADEEFEEF
jgi:methyl-accepting chemotaxis protein